MKRLLVTGGTGFIGRQIFQPLLEHGYEVHATATGTHPVVAGVVWHRCDLLDSSSVRGLIRDVRPSHLLHLAWYTEHGKFWTSPMNLDWTAASLDLARLFEAHGGRRLVIAGTCAEYSWGGPRLIEGETPTVPVTLYGAAKNSLRELLERFARVSGLSVAWGRVFLLYGPFEDPRRLVPSVVLSLLQGRPAETTAGEQLRDFLHSADVASAFVALLRSEVEGSVNIGSGTATRVRDVTELLGELLHRPELIRVGALPSRVDDPPAIVPDVRRLHEEVRWMPARDLRAGLEDTIAWWRLAPLGVTRA